MLEWLISENSLSDFGSEFFFITYFFYNWDACELDSFTVEVKNM